MEHALRGLLSRHKSLPIRQIVFDIFVHPEHDAACARRGASFLSPLSQRYRYALLIMDHEGSGREKISADDLQEAPNQEFRGLYTTLTAMTQIVMVLAVSGIASDSGMRTSSDQVDIFDHVLIWFLVAP